MNSFPLGSNSNMSLHSSAPKWAGSTDATLKLRNMHKLSTNVIAKMRLPIAFTTTNNCVMRAFHVIKSLLSQAFHLSRIRSPESHIAALNKMDQEVQRNTVGAALLNIAETDEAYHLNPRGHIVNQLLDKAQAASSTLLVDLNNLRQDWMSFQEKDRGKQFTVSERAVIRRDLKNKEKVLKYRLGELLKKPGELQNALKQGNMEFAVDKVSKRWQEANKRLAKQYADDTQNIELDRAMAPIRAVANTWDRLDALKQSFEIEIQDQVDENFIEAFEHVISQCESAQGLAEALAGIVGDGNEIHRKILMGETEGVAEEFKIASEDMHMLHDIAIDFTEEITQLLVQITVDRQNGNSINLQEMSLIFDEINGKTWSLLAKITGDDADIDDTGVPASDGNVQNGNVQ